MTKAMRLASIALALLLLAGSAEAATGCREWNAMTPDQRLSWLNERIRWGVTKSADAQKISVKQARMRRCMMTRRQMIIDDLNDVCSQGIRASMDAFDKLLQDHFWSCVGGEHG